LLRNCRTAAAGYGAPDEVPSRDGGATRAGAADADRNVEPGFSEAHFRQSQLRLLPGDAAPRGRRASLPAAGRRSKAVRARRHLPLRAIPDASPAAARM